MKYFLEVIFNSHQAVARQSPGSHQTVTRMSLDSHQIVTRHFKKDDSHTEMKRCEVAR
jgi:hypothetical protein